MTPTRIFDILDYQMKNKPLKRSLTSKVNGKRYIGSASRICDRWINHKFDLKNNKHHSIHLQNHYNKYGEDDLIFSVIEIIEALDGPISLTACVDSSENMCEASNICFLGGKWNKVNEIIRKSLNDISLDDLLNYEETFPIHNKKETELSPIN